MISPRCTIWNGEGPVIERDGPGGRHCPFGFVARSTFLYFSRPYAVKGIFCPGGRARARSPVGRAPSQRPERSGVLPCWAAIGIALKSAAAHSARARIGKLLVIVILRC